MIPALGSRNPVWFKLGILLLALNYPVGYVGLLIVNLAYVEMEDTFWLTVGGGCYAFSWVMLGVGFLLAGPEGLRRVRTYWRKKIKG